VTNGAKNLWRKVRSSPRSESIGTSPTPSTSSLNSVTTNSSNTNTGKSPSSGGLLSNLTSPRNAVRRRGSDPATSSTNSNSMTKQPDLPDVEEEALSRMQSAEAPINHHATSPGLSSQIMNWAKNQPSPDTESTTQHPRHASPPPRVEDVIPSQDEVHDAQGQGVQESIVEEMEIENRSDLEAGGALGLEKVDIKSETGDVQEWKHSQDWTSTHSHTNTNARRDPDVLGFDRKRFGPGN